MNETEIETEAVLDGNAAAGVLYQVFGRDVTVAVTECASCGALGRIGALVVYARAPGTVLRCASCGNVMMRVVVRTTDCVVELQGIRMVKLPAAGVP